MVLPCDCSSWAEVCPMGLVWDVRAICCPGHSHFLLSSFPLLGLAGACKVQGLLPAAVPPSVLKAHPSCSVSWCQLICLARGDYASGAKAAGFSCLRDLWAGEKDPCSRCLWAGDSAGWPTDLGCLLWVGLGGEGELGTKLVWAGLGDDLHTGGHPHPRPGALHGLPGTPSSMAGLPASHPLLSPCSVTTLGDPQSPGLSCHQACVPAVSSA